ncbi:peptidoglycan-binding protein [Streptomyces montanus]|uniref:Peptidoglycan-binding protein n=1 Tax=Streptomyces montanus TaxID=2580423 RepID=A0A5R9FM44_9ACTN|nr:peptidoglycan-binding domain-containing protein [Streptomyces montanus]TLS44391.1 peptidoglycan-binding protein [Streptomyces montanus]
MSIVTGVRRLAVAGCGSVLLASGLVAVTAGHAQAATPICTKTVTKSYQDFSGPVAAASNGSLNCQLGPGNSSSAVKALQNSLWRCSTADPGAIDGIYGPDTKAAVAKLQRAKGVSPIDGLYGPKTRTVFNWLIKGPRGAVCANF